ncbi:MAG: DUF3786 domain-containing protein [Dehalococcoidales bacterium]
MESSNLDIPSQRNYEYGYEAAYKIAADKLSRSDIPRLCVNSGARYMEGDNLILLDYLNRPHQIKLPCAEIALLGSEEPVPIREQVLILHYLTGARGAPTEGKMIAFKEIPEGNIYYPTFSKRAIEPVQDYFGPSPSRLLDAAANMGGKKVEYGDVAVNIRAFPFVKPTLIVWGGDEEFTPSANILFDASITRYLTTEDIVVLCETVVWKLVRYSSNQ